MTTSIFDKSDKGREEIATRCHRLAPRLRSLLVLIDGKQEIASVLKKVAGLGLDEHSIAELLDAGFIQEVAQHEAPAPLMTPATSDSAPAEFENPILPTGDNQFEAIYHFYNETIKSTIGLRGYALQLKVERCVSIKEFRELRQAYLEAILKAKGNEMARSLRDRLDQLLYLGETPPSHTTIIGPDIHT